MRLKPCNAAQSSSYSSSSSYSVSTLLAKPGTFELPMRLLKSITATSRMHQPVFHDSNLTPLVS